MNLLSLIMRECIALFVDDEFLAICVLAVVAVAALCSQVLVTNSLPTGIVLLTGIVGVLIWSVLRGAERSK